MALLPCAQAGCTENASYVVAETNRLNCLFDSGAGLCCDKHARELQGLGGIVLAMPAFADAIRSETAASAAQSDDSAP